MARRYTPKQGDFVWMDFDPQSGHEQAGKRPAIVVSVDSFNANTCFAICCPITNTDRQSAFHVQLEASSSLSGFVMCEQMKSIDYGARNIRYHSSCSDGFLDDVLSIVDACLYNP